MLTIHLRPRLVLANLCQAKMLSNPDDLFKFLYKKGIGGTHAAFWTCWALVAEHAGKYVLVER